MKTSGAFVVALVVVWLAVAFATLITTGGLDGYGGPYLNKHDLEWAKGHAAAGNARALDRLATHYAFTLNPGAGEAYRQEGEYWLERAASRGNQQAIYSYSSYLAALKLDCDAAAMWRARLNDSAENADWHELMDSCRANARDAEIRSLSGATQTPEAKSPERGPPLA